MAKTITVFTLTYCRKRELLYGTELIFKTLRQGFPNARVIVTDNASIAEVRPLIAEQARQTGCEYRQIEAPEIKHSDFIERTIREQAAAGETGATVILDPDILLWEGCEDFEFDGLMAGMFLDAFDDPAFQCVTMPRLHTSFYPGR